MKICRVCHVPEDDWAGNVFGCRDSQGRYGEVVFIQHDFAEVVSYESVDVVQLAEA